MFVRECICFMYPSCMSLCVVFGVVRMSLSVGMFVGICVCV